jgi:septum formation protein
VCVAQEGGLRSRLSVSHVTMRPYTDQEISAYVATGDPLDKAGAYAIQHPLFSPVARWEGCYAAIMGLPLKLAADLLGKAGIVVSEDVSAACEQLSGSRCCARAGQPLITQDC